MQFRIFIVTLALCVSGTTMLLGATKRSAAPRTVTSTTYATFIVRPAINLTDEPGPAMNGGHAEGVTSLAGTEPGVEHSVNSEFLLQSTVPASGEKADGRGVSVQRLSERKKVIVFLNN